MKMKRFLLACVGAALAFTMPGTTAQATDMESVLRRTSPWAVHEERDPEKGWRCFEQSVYFFGFLVRLPEEEPETVAGLPVTHPGIEWDESAPARAVLRSAAEFCEYVQCWDNGILGSVGDLLSGWQPQYQTTEFAVMTVPAPFWSGWSSETAQKVLDELESPESAFELIGAVYVTARSYGYCMGIDVVMETDDPDAWEAVQAEYGLTPPPEDVGSMRREHYYCNMDQPNDAAAHIVYLDNLYDLRDRLRADPRVSSAEIAWEIMTSGADDGMISVLPVYDFGTGDIDENGTANIGDAVLLARYLAEDNAITQPTQNGKNLADMDGDGTLDSADLAALLELLAN